MFLDTDTNTDPRMVPDKPSLPNTIRAKSMRKTGPAVKPGNNSPML